MGNRSIHPLHFLFCIGIAGNFSADFKESTDKNHGDEYGTDTKRIGYSIGLRYCGRIKAQGFGIHPRILHIFA